MSEKDYIEKEINEKYNVIPCKYCGKKPILRNYNIHGPFYIGCFNEEAECNNNIWCNNFTFEEAINIWNVLNNDNSLFNPNTELKKVLTICCANCRLRHKCELIKDKTNLNYFLCKYFIEEKSEE